MESPKTRGGDKNNMEAVHDMVWIFPGTAHYNIHVFRYFRYFYLFATQLHYLKMPKEKKKKNVGRDGEEA